jgi:CRISPR/Cas system-associated exonuclease Cas4 (RecB family)
LTATAHELAQWVERKLFANDPRFLIREEGEFRLTEVLRCASKLYFGVKTHSVAPPNAVMIRGRLLHSKLPEILAGHPDYTEAVYEEQIPIYTSEFPPYHIVGHSDIVISHSGIIDEWKFGEKPASAWDLGIATYLAQASEYAYALKMDEARLYYLNLRSFEIWDWTIKPIRDVHERIVDKARKIANSIHNNRIPDYDSPVFAGECRDCGFASFCPNFLGPLTPQEQARKEMLTAEYVAQSLQQYETIARGIAGTVQIAVGQNGSMISSETFNVQQQLKEAGYN